MPADDRHQVRASTVGERSISILFLLQTFSPIGAARTVKRQVERLYHWSKSILSRAPSKLSSLVLGEGDSTGELCKRTAQLHHSRGGQRKLRGTGERKGKESRT